MRAQRNVTIRVTVKNPLTMIDSPAPPTEAQLQEVIDDAIRMIETAHIDYPETIGPVTIKVY